MENQYYYNQIMDLYGFEKIKLLIKKWQNVSKNLNMIGNMPVILPNLLWINKPGMGKSYFLRLFSEYLAESNLMSFSGKSKWMEFSLNYFSDEQDFTDLRRLMREMAAKTGYRNVFKGVVSIELNQWIGHFETNHFKRLMAFLSENDNDLCIVFSLENAAKDEIAGLERVLAQYLRIETIVSEYPSIDEFYIYISDWLSEYDLTIADEAEILLKKSIAILRENDSFDGFKTLNLMCEDIVFEVCASINFKKTRILDIEDLKQYSENGTFIAKLREMSRKRKIGFGQIGGDE